MNRWYVWYAVDPDGTPEDCVKEFIKKHGTPLSYTANKKAHGLDKYSLGYDYGNLPDNHIKLTGEYYRSELNG